ncbi:MAG TPA: hypothetical protein VGB61_09340, partial [Pyrinomonadaceae bacterium]
EVLYEAGELTASDAGATEPDGSSGVSGKLSEIDRMRREIEDLDIEITMQHGGGMTLDADAAKGFVERARDIRVRLANLERLMGRGAQTSRVAEADALASETREYVENYGNESQKARFSALARELERAAARGDARGIQKLNLALRSLRGQILYAQEWFWREWFAYFQRPGHAFVNPDEAAKWLAQGEEAMQTDSRAKLEEAVRCLWKLEPVEQTAADKQRSMRPGLKF